MISTNKQSPIARVDHSREAARLRVLAQTATTAVIKARLLEQARHHDWLASLEPAEAKGPAPLSVSLEPALRVCSDGSA